MKLNFFNEVIRYCASGLVPLCFSLIVRRGVVHHCTTPLIVRSCCAVFVIDWRVFYFVSGTRRRNSLRKINKSFFNPGLPNLNFFCISNTFCAIPICMRSHQFIIIFILSACMHRLCFCFRMNKKCRTSELITCDRREWHTKISAFGDFWRLDVPKVLSTRTCFSFSLRSRMAFVVASVEPFVIYYWKEEQETKLSVVRENTVPLHNPITDIYNIWACGQLDM